MKKILLLSDTVLGQADKPIYIFTKNASILRISNQLRKNGITVKTLYHFLSFTPEEFEEILKVFTKNGKENIIFGISTSFLMYVMNSKFKVVNNNNNTLFGVNFEKILNFCLIAKKYNAQVVMGGWGVKLSSIHTLGTLNSVVDLFVEGDGCDILTNIAYNKSINIYQNINNFIFHKSPEIMDFSTQESSPISEDYINNKESLFTELGSGCIFSCSFCDYGLLGKKKTEFVRSYESLKKEIESNYKNFGTTFYTFSDNIVNDYQPKLEMLVKIKDELGIDLKWTGYVRLDTIKNKEQAQLLKDSGMIGASMGIESLHKTAGPYIGKFTDGDALKDKLRMCREIWKDSVIIQALMIAGLPTESIDDLENNFNFLISKEGKYLIDLHSYTRLILYDNQGTKNDINAKRMDGDPFKEYKKINSVNWESPWGHSNFFYTKAIKYNNIKNFLMVSPFSLPFVHNLDYNIEEMIKTIRQDNFWKNEDVEYMDVYFPDRVERKNKKIQEYKNNILNNLYK